MRDGLVCCKTCRQHLQHGPTRGTDTLRDPAAQSAYRARPSLILAEAAVAGDVREVRHAGCRLHTGCMPSATAW